MYTNYISVNLIPAVSTVLRRTVSNDRTSLPLPPLFAPPMQRRNLYTWVNPMPQDSPPSMDEYDSVSRNTVRSPILHDPVLTSVARRGPVQPTSLKIIARTVPQPVNSYDFIEYLMWYFSFPFYPSVSLLLIFRSMDQHCCLRGRNGIMELSQRNMGISLLFHGMYVLWKV